jgi:hypothetical protein
MICQSSYRNVSQERVSIDAVITFTTIYRRARKPPPVRRVSHLIVGGAMISVFLGGGQLTCVDALDPNETVTQDDFIVLSDLGKHPRIGAGENARWNGPRT